MLYSIFDFILRKYNVAVSRKNLLSLSGTLLIFGKSLILTEFAVDIHEMQTNRWKFDADHNINKEVDTVMGVGSVGPRHPLDFQTWYRYRKIET